MVFQFLKNTYQKIKSALAKAQSLLGTKLRALFKGKINEETLEQLEQTLYEADFGVQTSMELSKKIQELYQKNPQISTDECLSAIQSSIVEILNKHPSTLKELSPEEGPLVVLIVGVNGNGKTTSVAKLAKLFKDQGKKVLVAAADTFRAAAIEQLTLWAEQLKIDIVKGSPKSDPAAVAFDAVTAGKARQCDVVIIDTAGRLHTKTNLMHELGKIRRSCAKLSPHAPHETLLVLDATTGQNAIDQAKTFHSHTPLTGLILTKLDGTAKGGIVVSIQRELGIPVKFVGIGETVDDFAPFDPQIFANSLFD
jgi:fused signal recognition particle receptor